MAIDASSLGQVLGRTSSRVSNRTGCVPGSHRVHLARMLKEGANVLLLDEPTNDLDVKAISCGGPAPLPPPTRRYRPPRPHARAGKAGHSLCARSRTPSSNSPGASS